MYIIVMGGGQVGYHLTRTLMQKGHEVLLVEKDHRRALLINEELGPPYRGGWLRPHPWADGTSRRWPLSRHDDEDNLVAAVSKRNWRAGPSPVNDPRNETSSAEGIDETVPPPRD